jgi:5-carboxymethyl-2-hydroxymuconate isomerase
VPHLIVEYSANLEDDIRLDALLDDLHQAALDTGVFPLGGLRTRAHKTARYRIADCHPDNAFVHVTAIIGHGRPLDVRRSAAERLFGTLTRHLESVYQRRPLAISFNVQEFHPELNFKQNNLHEYVQSRLGRAPRNGRTS